MDCPKCRKRVSYGPLLLPHRCRVVTTTRASPTAALDLAVEAAFGTGPEWAKSVYGDYYATSNLVYAAVKLKADAVARPRLRVYRVNGEDKQEIDPDHPLQVLLRRVNPWWTGIDLWRLTSMHLDLWGSSFWALERGTGGLPTEIWPLRPDRVRIVADEQRYVREFVYFASRGERHFLPQDIIWFREVNPLDELSGLSPVAPLRLSIDATQDAELHNRNVFVGGLLNDSVITSQGPVTDDQVNDLWVRLRKKFAGPKNSHRPMVLGDGLEVKQMALSAKDMEFLGFLRWGVEQTSRAFNVPKTLLHDLERATYSNIDAEERILWRNAIVPRLQFLAAEVNEMLTPQFGPDLEVEFDLSDIEALQADENAIAQSEREDVKLGIVTINEARQRRGMEPVPWGDEPPAALPPLGGFSSQPTEEGPVPEEPAAMMTALSASSYRLYRPPELTDEFLHRMGQAHEERLARFGKRFQDLQQGLFQRQRAEALRRVRQGAKTLEEIFIVKSWIVPFLRDGKPLVQNSLLQSAQHQISTFGLGVSFDVNNEILQNWLDDRLTFWAERTNEETARLLLSELQDAQRAGESIRDIQGRVEKVFGFSDSVRSERIARTEIQSATNHGALEAYRQSGIVREKMWLTSIDGRERDSHREAHRQVVPLEGMFSVGGEMLAAPGDTRGSAKEIINCRCTISPVVRRNQRRIWPADKPEFDGQALTDQIDQKLTAEFALLESRLEQRQNGRKIVKTVTRDDLGFPVKVVEEHVN